MDFSIAAILGLDGVTNGAIYALLAIALVLVFAVTRVIFIPQGEYVAFGALTMALLQDGRVPGTVWLLLLMTALAAVLDAAQARRERWPVRRAGPVGSRRPRPELRRFAGPGPRPASPDSSPRPE